MANYNCEKFISQAILSLVEQTYSDWELIFVDDCSTDNSLKIFKELIKKFNIENKTKIFKNEKNMGFGYTLKKAIEYGNGDIIAPLDSDDVIAEKDALKKIMKCHKKYPDAVMIYTNHWECNQNLKKIREYKSSQKKGKDDYLTGNNGFKMSHWKTFKRKFYNLTEGVNPNLRQTVDKDLILKLEEVGDFIHLPESLYLYRKHENNLTRSVKHKPKEYRNQLKYNRIKIFEDAKKRREYGDEIKHRMEK
jgi:glycosyltransferase involved in cell wall biosynthesis